MVQIGINKSGLCLPLGLTDWDNDGSPSYLIKKVDLSKMLTSPDWHQQIWSVLATWLDRLGKRW